MTPSEYERAVASALTVLGWNASLTPGSGDLGADVIARCGEETLVVQCKRYGQANYVGFDAVKDACFAQRHYKASLAAVVFAGRISRQARSTARAHDVLLLTLRELKTGCILDRSIEGRQFAERVRAEQAAEARLNERREQLANSRSLVSCHEAWVAYDAALPRWQKDRSQWAVDISVQCGGSILAVAALTA